MISLPTDGFLPHRHSRPLAFIKKSGDAKRMVRIFCVLTILQFVYSPSFQLIWYFRGYCAIRDIAAHRWIFAPPPPPSARVYYRERRCKKNGEILLCFDNFTVCLLTVFHHTNSEHVQWVFKTILARVM